MKKLIDDPAAVATLVLAFVTVCAIVIPLITAALDRRSARKARLREIAILLRIIELGLIGLGRAVRQVVPTAPFEYIAHRILTIDAASVLDSKEVAEVFRATANALNAFHYSAKTREEFMRDITGGRSIDQKVTDVAIYDGLVEMLEKSIETAIHDVAAIASTLERIVNKRRALWARWGR